MARLMRSTWVASIVVFPAVGPDAAGPDVGVLGDGAEVVSIAHPETSNALPSPQRIEFRSRGIRRGMAVIPVAVSSCVVGWQPGRPEASC